MMKHLLVCLFFMLLGLPMMAESTYEVTAASLNVRSHPSTASQVIGKKSKGEQIVVTDKVGARWVEIRMDGGQKGYVSSKFVREVKPATSKKEFDWRDSRSLRFWSKIIVTRSLGLIDDARLQPKVLLKYMFILEGILAFILLFFNTKKRSYLSVPLSFVFLALCALEVAYYLMPCQPMFEYMNLEKSGALTMIVSAIIYVIFGAVQIACFNSLLYSLNECLASEHQFSWGWSQIMWTCTTTAVIVGGIIVQPWMDWITLGIIAVHAIFILSVAVYFIWHGHFFSWIYLLAFHVVGGSITFVATFLSIGVFAILTLAFFIFYFCSTLVTSSKGLLKDGSIIFFNGVRKVRLTPTSGGDFKDECGKKWEAQANNKYKEVREEDER